MRYLLTGPTRGDISRFNEYKECSFVILGDAYLNNPKILKSLNGTDNLFYCVRGLDEKVEYIDNLDQSFDENVQGFVWFDKKYPFIRYLIDGQIYRFDGVKCLVLGGGSNPNEDVLLVKGDKNLSLDTGYRHEENIYKRVANKEVDLLLTYSKLTEELNGKTEQFIDIIQKNLKWKSWYIGRFGEDVDITPTIKYINEDLIDFAQYKVIESTDDEYNLSEIGELDV